MSFGTRQVAERLDGYGEVGAEDRVAEGLVKALEERRRGEAASAVVSGCVPVRAGLRLHVLLERGREARQPEALEEVDDAFVITRGTFQHARLLLRPAARGKRDLGVTGTREHNLGDRGEEHLQPLAGSLAVDRRLHHVVVNDEEAAGASGLGQYAARTAAGEERLSESFAVLRDHELERRIIKRRIGIESLAAEVAERIVESVLDDRKTTGVEASRLMKIEDRKRSDHICAYYSTFSDRVTARAALLQGLSPIFQSRDCPLLIVHNHDSTANIYHF